MNDIFFIFILYWIGEIFEYFRFGPIFQICRKNPFLVSVVGYTIPKVDFCDKIRVSHKVEKKRFYL